MQALGLTPFHNNRDTFQNICFQERKVHFSYNNQFLGVFDFNELGRKMSQNIIYNKALDYYTALWRQSM